MHQVGHSRTHRSHDVQLSAMSVMVPNAPGVLTVDLATCPGRPVVASLCPATVW